MQTARIDMTGKTFGLLKVMAYTRSDEKGRAFWLCRCRCRNTRVVRGVELRAGRATACRRCAGEQRRARLREARRVTGEALKALRRRDPEGVLALLSPEKQAEYERWEKACRKIQHAPTKGERLDVLRELAT